MGSFTCEVIFKEFSGQSYIFLMNLREKYVFLRFCWHFHHIAPSWALHPCQCAEWTMCYFGLVAPPERLQPLSESQGKSPNPKLALCWLCIMTAGDFQQCWGKTEINTFWSMTSWSFVVSFLCSFILFICSSISFGISTSPWLPLLPG